MHSMHGSLPWYELLWMMDAWMHDACRAPRLPPRLDWSGKPESSQGALTMPLSTRAHCPYP
jgi:hypothetical protein